MSYEFIQDSKLCPKNLEKGRICIPILWNTNIKPKQRSEIVKHLSQLNVHDRYNLKKVMARGTGFVTVYCFYLAVLLMLVAAIVKLV